MKADGSCPTCGVTRVGRDEFTYVNEGDALTGLTCMATCRGCGAVWIEVYRLERIIGEVGTVGGDPAPAASPDENSQPTGARGRIVRRRGERR
jgi:Zn-finger nucleic acid-binding protein